MKNIINLIGVLFFYALFSCATHANETVYDNVGPDATDESLILSDVSDYFISSVFKGLSSAAKAIYHAVTGKKPVSSGEKPNEQGRPKDSSASAASPNFCDEIMTKYETHKKMAAALHPDRLCKELSKEIENDAKWRECVSGATELFSKAKNCY